MLAFPGGALVNLKVVAKIDIKACILPIVSIRSKISNFIGTEVVPIAAYE